VFKVTAICTGEASLRPSVRTVSGTIKGFTGATDAARTHRKTSGIR
jgi:hypothetical protein